MTKESTFTPRDLHGIWAALPVPWQENGALDRRTFSRDIARLCQAKVHGLYSGGTTGEFYVQDFDLFKDVNSALVETAHAHLVPVQAGCTALGTDEACRRVSFACEIGADVIQIALPFWLELDDDEVLRFFETIATFADSTPLVHYDTGRAKRRISPGLYQELCRRVPTLWGTKFGGTDIGALKAITTKNPELRIFVSESILASATPMGAVGSYSAMVNINPAWMLEYYEACHTGKWDRAFAFQNEACHIIAGLGEFVTPNLQDTAIDRILGRLAGFLECPLAAKGPYRHGTEEDVQRLRRYVETKMPHVLNFD